MNECRHPAAVLLLSASDLVWTGVHVAVQSISDVEIVDDVTDLSLAVERARELQPDAVVTGLSVADTAMLPVLREIRHHCPGARLIVLADHFGPRDLLVLGELNAAAYLLWNDLDFSSLRQCMAAALCGDFVVLSRPAYVQLRDVGSAGPPAGADAAPLSDRERLVLEGLATGLTQEQIARTAQLGLRTVKRTTAALAARLQAPSPFVLGMKARELGIVPPDV